MELIIFVGVFTLWFGWTRTVKIMIESCAGCPFCDLPEFIRQLLYCLAFIALAVSLYYVYYPN